MNVNMAWAGALVDEWVRAGVDFAVLSPGSRSAPLALSILARKEIESHVVVDERSAAFVALGRAKASGKPSLLVCTSGTAMAHYLPAVIEAHQSGVGLIVCTADRPHELRNVGANQAIEQPGLYGSYTSFACDVMLPEARAPSFRFLRQLACRAASFANHGPVHLNVPFREPLDDRPADAVILKALRNEDPAALVGRAGGAPYMTITQGTATAKVPPLAGSKGLVVVGPMRQDLSRELTALTQAGFAVLTDAVSARREGLVYFDSYLEEHGTSLRPDWVVQVGAAPTSKALKLYLESMPDVPRIRIDSGKLWDDTHQAQTMVVADPVTALGELARRKGNASWLARWVKLEKTVTKVLASSNAPECVAARSVAAHPGPVWVGSSLPVRDLQRYGGVRHQPVMANRGASGIDGTLSSACGAASTGGTWLAYMGDMTFMHDVSALALLTKTPNLRVVVADNGGGRIFEHLDVARHASAKDFAKAFLAKTDVDMAMLCHAFGVPHRACEPHELAAILADGGHGVVQVRIQDGLARRKRLQKSIDESLA